MNIRDLLKPDAWYCQKCAGALTFHAEGSQAYSCERCKMMWPAENIVLFGYADLTDESFIDSRAPVVAPQGDEADNERKIAVRYLVKQGFVRCDQPEHGCDGWHERLTT